MKYNRLALGVANGLDLKQMSSLFALFSVFGNFEKLPRFLRSIIFKIGFDLSNNGHLEI